MFLASALAPYSPISTRKRVHAGGSNIPGGAQAADNTPARWRARAQNPVRNIFSAEHSPDATTASALERSETLFTAIWKCTLADGKPLLSGFFPVHLLPAHEYGGRALSLRLLKTPPPVKSKTGEHDLPFFLKFAAHSEGANLFFSTDAVSPTFQVAQFQPRRLSGHRRRPLRRVPQPAHVLGAILEPALRRGPRSGSLRGWGPTSPRWESADYSKGHRAHPRNRLLAQGDTVGGPWRHGRNISKLSAE